MSLSSFLSRLFIRKEITVFKFNSSTVLDNWIIVSDSVMGGISTSAISLNEKTKGIFTGEVSLENNGGFTLAKTQVHINFPKRVSKIQLKLKGDGKQYQFRIKPDLETKHWYIQKFETNTTWQLITLKLKDFYPSLRGNQLEISNFENNQIKAIAFLIGNKRQEHFKLIIDEIKLIR